MIEKSARDGLRENAAYECFKRCASEVINILEQRRFAFRQKEGYGRRLRKLGIKLAAAFGFDDFRTSVMQHLRKSKVAENTIAEIEAIISSKESDGNIALFTAREITFDAREITASISLGVTIISPAFSESTDASITVGTPIATTGTPRLFCDNSFRVFFTPEPGAIPESVI